MPNLTSIHLRRISLKCIFSHKSVNFLHRTKSLITHDYNVGMFAAAYVLVEFFFVFFIDMFVLLASRIHTQFNLIKLSWK